MRELTKALATMRQLLLKIGDNIWLENNNIQLNQPSKKLDNKRYEPFRILKDIGSGAF